MGGRIAKCIHQNCYIRRQTPCITLLIVTTALLIPNCHEGFILSHRRSKGGCQVTDAIFHRFSDAVRHPTAAASIPRFPDDVVNRLDLIPLLRGIADHAGTRRGRQALLALVGQDSNHRSTTSINIPARRRRVMQQYNAKRDSVQKKYSEIISLVMSAEEARIEYNLVDEALLALDDAPLGPFQTDELTYPPLYAVGSSPEDTSTSMYTDDDDWMRLPLEDLSLEHVLQAEQVLITLLQVKKWAQRTDVSIWLPGLSAIGRCIPHDDLLPVLNNIGKSVEVSRVRSLTDPDGRSTFAFRLSEAKFPLLAELRAKEHQLVDLIDRQMKTILRKTKGSPEYLDYDGRNVLLLPKSAVTPELGLVRGSNAGRCYVEPRSVVEYGDKLAETRREISSYESQIQQDLIQTILRAQHLVDASLQIMARLDVIFARAAFGRKLGGSIPKIGCDGCIAIEQFIHPVLATDTSESVVPIDLYIANNRNATVRSLIISGPNGGGKSVAMKSFGVASVLTRIAVPIPQRSGATPRVDYFYEVVIELGDHQSLCDGQSTFMAKVNACSRLIQQAQAKEQRNSHTLILFDEIGSGTDPDAGGAIGQAVLEEILENDSVRVVCTTHSPRLKVLGFNDPRFSCATVLLKHGNGNFKLPSFQLQYGHIGDSYALGVASRSNPPLPESVIARATSLLASSLPGDGGNDDAMRGVLFQALTNSLEKQVDEVILAQQQVESLRDDLKSCHEAMLAVAQAYQTKFTQMEHRLESLVQRLHCDKDNTLEVIGNTISTLKIAKKHVKSEIDILREKGLKLVPYGYDFVPGETVIVISKGGYEGTSVTVVERDGTDSVLVVPQSNWDDPLFDPESPGEMHPRESQPLSFKYYELAIWDFDSVFKVDPLRSFPERAKQRQPKQNLDMIFSSLGDEKKTDEPAHSRTTPSPVRQFVSSRERKAAKSAKKKKKK